MVEGFEYTQKMVLVEEEFVIFDKSFCFLKESERIFGRGNGKQFRVVANDFDERVVEQGKDFQNFIFF
jgi:hypothetical protein